MKIALISLICLISAAVLDAKDSSLDARWALYKTTFQKKYSSDREDAYRKQVWKSNLDSIEAHNVRYNAGEISFYLGETKFTDLTEQEFKNKMLSSFPSSLVATTAHKGKNVKHVSKQVSDLPDSVDWRQKGAVNPIKNQQHCGSCWAFSAMSALESQIFLKTGSLPQLAEQQLVDCDKEDIGCHGGLPVQAYDYLHTHGPMQSKDYPYVARRRTCKYSQSKAMKVSVDSVMWAESGDEASLQSLIAEMGPVSIAIDASYNFQNYKGGVFVDESCGSGNDTLNHAVVAVGYGATQDGKDYFIVRNSWDTDWGMDGYALFARNKDNMCGISNMGCVPVIKK